MKQKVLFLCTQNSARSQMAEGFLKTLFSEKYDSYSAGLKPYKINFFAVEVMKEAGIDISKQYSKNINEYKNITFDLIITVCDNAKETCPFFPGGKLIHKNFNDPASFTGGFDETLKIFRKIRDEIRDWIIDNFGSEKIL